MPVQSDFSPSETVLCPFEVGQLVGVVRFPRKTTDFATRRSRGAFTRCGTGCSRLTATTWERPETRDFLVLSPAAEDKDPAKLEAENLYKISRDASATTHPAIMPMQVISPDVADDAAPAMVHDESRETVELARQGDDRNRSR